ncbi:UPF0481 protein At3g47200-like [Eucalyptus grandis]|uniref:UPF0481 protein At3g47200-like n=1 Tax=Eucalyptus grandis TaxID=71139 RepID=UPI00192EFCCE|nr:UPF0481 protein At3g47200-like [Eucalyptus grandis]
MSPSTPTTDLNKTNWIVEVTEDVEHMRSNFDDERHWKKHSIYRVPDCVAKLNREAYRPEAVSFGPYHHGEDHLLPMENHKHRALLHFLRRSGKPDSYHLLDPWWKEGDGEGAGPFLKLMITDGCFMLEILRTKIRLRGNTHPTTPFSVTSGLYIRPYIMRDMLMLENQLPMLVLDRLVAVESDGMQAHPRVFLLPCTPNEKMGKCLHVLDVYRKRLLLPGNPDEVGPEDGERTIQSATELEEAGIRLEKSRTDSFKDISFAGGVLRLPPIMVNDTTESKFLNLMTFERFHDGAGNEVTAYMYFMDDIIDTERDVTLLNARGIIQNDFGSDKAVAELFNSLNKDMALDENNSLEALRNKVSKYCKKPWNKWRANLIKTYFRSPWSILSLLCAIFLFTLTIIQTIYTVSPAG